MPRQGCERGHEEKTLRAKLKDSHDGFGFRRGTEMSTKITNLTNKAGETVGTVSFDESAHSWRIASKAEPNFQRTFSRETEAFYFWYSRFDPQTGKLRRFPPE
jgi:hypothetical protein